MIISWYKRPLENVEQVAVFFDKIVKAFHFPVPRIEVEMEL
jgi:hypothetical protein